MKSDSIVVHRGSFNPPQLQSTAPKIEQLQWLYLEIFFSHFAIIKQAKIVDGVASEPRHVQRYEVEVQTDDGFSFEIDVALRIEGDGPRQEVNPSHDGTKYLQDTDLESDLSLKRYKEITYEND